MFLERSNDHDGGVARQVIGMRDLNSIAYVLRIDCPNFTFQAGQHITLGLHGDEEIREYSVYSAPGEPFVDVLIAETDPGLVSRKLRQLKPGDWVDLNGPFGFFTLPEEQRTSVLAVATGTGIAPFHSMSLAYPDLDLTLVHGIRDLSHAYDCNDYAHYVSCTSRSLEGDFHGRVTEYLQEQTIDPSLYVYLCGNCDMIFAVYDQLQIAGVPTRNIKTEVYF